MPALNGPCAKPAACSWAVEGGSGGGGLEAHLAVPLERKETFDSPPGACQGGGEDGGHHSELLVAFLLVACGH